LPVYCRKCRQEVADLLATETSTQCPNCGAPISFKDGIPRAIARLLLKDGDDTKGEFQVSAAITIGKDKSNYVQLLHPTIALKHAEVSPAASGYRIKDLGSSTGTHVNGQRISGEAPLKDGDEIRVGDIRFLFLNPPESILPGQEIQISYTAGANDIDMIQSSLPPERLSLSAAAGRTGAGKAKANEVAAAASAELERLARVYDIGRELASATEAAVILERIMDAVYENAQPSRVAILLRHTSGELYTALARTAKGGKQRATMSISRTIVHETLARREAVLIADTGTLEVAEEHTIRRQGIRSAICVPLVFKGSPLGAIYLDSLDLTHMFTESDLRLVAGIGGMAAVAIVNARLVSRLKHEEEMRKELELKRTGEGWASGMTGLALREVTVLVIRLMGTGHMLEGSHPERVATLLSELMGIINDRLQPLEGTLAGVSGASIIAVWGLFRHKDSDVVAAVRGAFDVRDMFAQLNSARTKRSLRPIQMTFAVCTGRVLAGQMNFRGRAEPAVVGGAVDVASFLAARGAQEQILLTGSTVQRVTRQVETVPLDPMTHAEGEDPVPVYEARRIA
jgi:pSer/pThr/pTyr-binding forkhead associated (FHA) protein/class 3 adenylate cyclase